MQSPNSLSKRLGEWMRAHPLFSFFFIAYTFSWILSIPYILSQWGILHGDFSLTFFVKSFGPHVAAYLMVRVVEGRDGWLRFRARIRQTRAGWGWYAFLLLLIPAPTLLGIITQPGALDNISSSPIRLAVTYVVTLVLVFFGGGPLGEEPGWRGFALPRLQPRYGPLKGTLLLGLMWTFWHLPDFLTTQQGGGPGTGLTPFVVNLPIFLLFVTALAIIFTWVFNHTGGSIFIAILMHACINTPQAALVPLFPTLDFTTLDLAALVGYGTLAFLIVILTRGRLGYPSAQQEPESPADLALGHSVQS